VTSVWCGFCNVQWMLAILYCQSPRGGILALDFVGRLVGWYLNMRAATMENSPALQRYRLR
jgi:hypothetical protein